MITIYRIRNKISDSIYIGIDSNYPERYKAHIRRKGNRLIASALKEKYTPDDFEVSILTQVTSRRLANWLEEYYIWYYDCIAPNGYNLKGGGDSGKPSKESVQKGIETKRKNGTLKRSEECIRKRQAARMANGGYVVTEEQIRKILETKEKNGTTGRGRKKTKEHVKKIQEAKRRNGTNKPTKEQIRKMLETKEKNGTTGKGVKKTPESVRKRLETMYKNGTTGKGKKKSAEHRAKIGAANKGKKRTEEQKKVISERRKGQKLSEEHKAKIRAANKGKIVSAETRARMSAAVRRRRACSSEFQLKLF